MKNKTFRIVIIVLSFLLCMYFPKMLISTFNIPGSALFITSLGYPFTLLIIIAALYALYRLNITGIISALGLKKGFSSGLLFGLAATLPMTVGSIILFKFSDNIFSYDTLVAVIFAPVMEEILFRGYLFGQLFKKEGWGFIPASIIASVFFGIGHLYQSHDLLSASGTFLVTFAGSAWFAWLYLEHNSNLWVPVWLHIFMNFTGTVFLSGSPGAIGNNITNLLRLITIIITVVYTIRYSRKHGRKVNRNNLFINDGKKPVKSASPV